MSNNGLQFLRNPSFYFMNGYNVNFVFLIHKKNDYCEGIRILESWNYLSLNKLNLHIVDSGYML